MKQIALLLIAFSISCTGFFISSRLAQRVRMIKSTCLFLSGIKTEIEFSLESAVEIFERLSPVYLKDIPFVDICRQKLVDTHSFTDAWEAALSSKEYTKDLKREDILLLSSFGKSFGTTDINGQITNCEMHINLLQTNLQKAEHELKLYKKPAAAIGLLTGCAIYILLM